MADVYMDGFTVPGSIDNTRHIIALNGTANEKIPIDMLAGYVATLLGGAKNNVRFVDLAGDDGTAIVGRLDKPYSTLAGALAVAGVNESIIVLSCDEANAIILKQNIGIRFIGGEDRCKIDGFTDDGVAVACFISGKHTAYGPIILSAAGSTVDISDISIDSNGYIFNVTGAGAALRVLNSRVQSYNATTAGSPVNINDASTITIIDSIIKSASTNHRAVNTNSSGILNIKDSVIVSAHTESIDAAAANFVYVYGTLSSNKAKNSNVTIKIGNFVVDTLVDFI